VVVATTVNTRNDSARLGRQPCAAGLRFPHVEPDPVKRRRARRARARPAPAATAGRSGSRAEQDHPSHLRSKPHHTSKRGAPAIFTGRGLEGRGRLRRRSRRVWRASGHRNRRAGRTGERLFGKDGAAARTCTYCRDRRRALSTAGCRYTAVAKPPHARSGHPAGGRGRGTTTRARSRSWGRSGPGCPERRKSTWILVFRNQRSTRSSRRLDVRTRLGRDRGSVSCCCVACIEDRLKTTPDVASPGEGRSWACSQPWGGDGRAAWYDGSQPKSRG
jgi:hypothetical protein